MNHWKTLASAGMLAILILCGQQRAFAQPATSDQAARGQAAFKGACASCHGATAQGGPGGPPLAGPAFQARWLGLPAGALLSYIREKMPAGAPGSLSDQIYADATAFVLQANGVKPEAAAAASTPAPQPQKPDHASVLAAVLARDTLPPDAVATPVLAARKALVDGLRPVTDALLRDPPPGSWLNWRRTYDAQGFGPETQINRETVSRLSVAWAWQLAPSPNEIAPLVHDGVLFVSSAGRLEALNAKTGDLLWQYQRPGTSHILRSISLYGDNVYMAAGGDVIAVDMHTGKMAWDTKVIGADGGAFSIGPIAVKGKVFQGSGGCGTRPGGCFVVALDAATGKEAWRFYTVQRPGDPGADSWNGVPLDQRTGASIWSPPSYDPELDLLYFGTGQSYHTAALATGPGINDRAAGLYNDTTLALRPDTGKLAWYYQHMDGDIWDLDWAFERTLATVLVDGKPRRTVTTAGKLGIFDTLDAATGQYLRSTDLGVQTLVTSIDPKTGHKNIDPAAMREAGGTKHICPGSFGGRIWTTTSYNPQTGVLFVPANEACMDVSWLRDSFFDIALRELPGNKDGMVGRVQALDLATGKTLWVARERSPHVSAVLATAGGLVFEGDKDRWFRARDDRTGKVLWQMRLDAPPTSYPITYSVDDEQYVAVTTGGGGSMEMLLGGLTPEVVTPSTGSSTLWVFKLPRP